MIDEARERLESVREIASAAADRLRAWATRPPAVRSWLWRRLRSELSSAIGRWAAFRKYETMIRLGFEARERWPDLFRGRRPIDVGSGVRSLSGAIWRLRIEERFAELRPLHDFLDARGYDVEKFDDVMKSCRRYKVTSRGETDRWGGRVRVGYLIVDVGSNAKCEVIERTVEQTEYEIVCEGERELRGLSP